MVYIDCLEYISIQSWIINCNSKSNANANVRVSIVIWVHQAVHESLLERKVRKSGLAYFDIRNPPVFQKKDIQVRTAQEIFKYYSINIKEYI